MARRSSTISAFLAVSNSLSVGRMGEPSVSLRSPSPCHDLPRGAMVIFVGTGSCPASSISVSALTRHARQTRVVALSLVALSIGGASPISTRRLPWMPHFSQAWGAQGRPGTICAFLQGLTARRSSVTPSSLASIFNNASSFPGRLQTVGTRQVTVPAVTIISIVTCPAAL